LKWTAEEDKLLAETYLKIPIQKIYSMLPNRTVCSIKARVDRANLNNRTGGSCSYKTALPPDRWSDMAWVLKIIDQATMIGRKTNINLRLLHGVLAKGR
jgi:hypothetical protein